MEDKQQKLFDRLDANLADFQKKWEAQSKHELISDAHEIYAVKSVHEYLSHSHGFEAEEVEYLLLFDNPLQIVADKWQDRIEDTSDISFALAEVFDKRDAMRDYPMAKDKPSVLEKLRATTNLVSKASLPAKEQEVR